jgi:hypothetical protein
MRYTFIILVPLVMFVLWGCQNGSDPVETDQRIADQQAILANIGEIEASDTADYFYADLNEESEDMFITPANGLMAKPIVPMKFGRIGLRPVVRDIRVEFTSDTTARVLFYKVLRGKFVVLTMDTSYVFQHIDRKMGHKFTRLAYFVKRGNSDESLRARWRLAATSVVEGKSLGLTDSTRVKTSLTIEKVEIQNEGNTIEIVDPLTFVQKRNDLLTLVPGTEVTVTVYVRNDAPDQIQVPAGEGTELVRLHFGRHPNWRQYEMYGIRYLRWTGQGDNGTNIYEGTWTVGSRSRINHAVVDVIDNGCIFDDDTQAYPYNSVTWGIPYRVKPM